MKIMNPDWDKIDVEPIDIALRNKIGRAFDVDEFKNMPAIIDDMVANADRYTEDIRKAREETVYNLYTAKEHAGKYIIQSLLEKQEKHKTED